MESMEKKPFFFFFWGLSFVRGLGLLALLQSLLSPFFMPPPPRSLPNPNPYSLIVILILNGQWSRWGAGGPYHYMGPTRQDHYTTTYWYLIQLPGAILEYGAA